MERLRRAVEEAFFVEPGGFPACILPGEDLIYCRILRSIYVYKERQVANPSIAIYLDTNVYSRPFDDQTQFTIQEEANAFLEIIQAVETKDLVLICSDILVFEVDNILIEEKRARIRDYLSLCIKCIGNSKRFWNLANASKTIVPFEHAMLCTLLQRL